MPDRLWFTLAAALAVLMIGFAAVWPQGFGARSPGPFGHAEVVPTQPGKAAGVLGAKAPSIGLDGLSPAPPAAPGPAAPAGLRPAQ